jgi:hypothetical protein
MNPRTPCWFFIKIAQKQTFRNLVNVIIFIRRKFKRHLSVDNGKIVVFDVNRHAARFQLVLFKAVLARLRQ